MLIALVLGFLALALSAYFLHLFFHLNRSERKLQALVRDVEATMLMRYGKQGAKEKSADDEDEDDEAGDGKSSHSKSLDKKA